MVLLAGEKGTELGMKIRAGAVGAGMVVCPSVLAKDGTGVRRGKREVLGVLGWDGAWPPLQKVGSRGWYGMT